MHAYMQGYIHVYIHERQLVGVDACLYKCKDKYMYLCIHKYMDDMWIDGGWMHECIQGGWLDGWWVDETDR